MILLYARNSAPGPLVFLVDFFAEVVSILIRQHELRAQDLLEALVDRKLLRLIWLIGFAGLFLLSTSFPELGFPLVMVRRFMQAI